jgi:TetR/AcrR family transcriptional regulator
MSDQNFEQETWQILASRIHQLEQQGLVTRTFRRLDPQRQVDILDAILYEAAEKGLNSANISEVARRAGVSVGSMYQYFGNRQAMIDFSIDISVNYMMDVIDAYKPYMLAMPTLEALSSYISSGIEMTKTQAGMLKFFSRAAYQGDPLLNDRVVKPIADVMYGLVRDILQKARERGELHEEIDLEATARLLNAILIIVGDSQLFPYLNTYLNLTTSDLPLERIMAAFTFLAQKGIIR